MFVGRYRLLASIGGPARFVEWSSDRNAETSGFCIAKKGLVICNAPAIYDAYGLLAQLVERLVYTENVGGSSPSRPTIPPSLNTTTLTVACDPS